MLIPASVRLQAAGAPCRAAGRVAREGNGRHRLLPPGQLHGRDQLWISERDRRNDPRPMERQVASELRTCEPGQGAVINLREALEQRPPLNGLRQGMIARLRHPPGPPAQSTGSAVAPPRRCELPVVADQRLRFRECAYGRRP